MLFDPKLSCRVCGLRQPEPPWGATGTDPSFEICACCGVEFGYEDTTREAAVAYRMRWIKGGATWFAPKEQPANWSLEDQLKNVPNSFRD